jgi:hypothetical protein
MEIETEILEKELHFAKPYLQYMYILQYKTIRALKI